MLAFSSSVLAAIFCLKVVAQLHAHAGCRAERCPYC